MQNRSSALPSLIEAVLTIAALAVGGLIAAVQIAGAAGLF